MEKFKKLGAYVILSTMLSGLFFFGPPVLKGVAAVYNFGRSHAELLGTIHKHDEAIKTNAGKIQGAEASMREFRSVWCLDRLSSSDRLSSEVLKSCTTWIKNP